MIVIAILAVGLGMAYRQWRASRAPVPPGVMAQMSDTSATDSVVAQALRQIPALVDSEAIKNNWTENVRGVDLAALRPERLDLFLRFANSERCTCGCGYTLAACRAYDLTCPVSLPRVQSLYDSVANGVIRSAAGLRQRPVRRT